MNSIAAYVEMLLRKHECVVLPGFGAFLCNYVPAHFSDDNGLTINPPSRSLAFNGVLVESDGLLASSVARKEGIPYEAAVRRVAEEVELLRRQLDAFGEFQFGNMGIFHVGAEGQTAFSPNSLPSVNGPLYGLRPVEVMPLDYKAGLNEQASEIAETVSERVSMRSGAWRAYATGIVASLAVIVTAALFLMSPIRVSRSTSTASIAPVPAENLVPAAASAEYDAVWADAAEIGRLASIAMKEAESDIVTEQAVLVGEEPVAVASADDMQRRSDAVRNEPNAIAVRFNESDPFCVIVASFPTKDQADAYVSAHAGNRLGILEKDSRFRVYAATGATYRDAGVQKNLSGQDDAWVCRR